MAIVPLNKVTLFGAASNKTEVLDQLQSLGCVHLVNLSSSDSDNWDQREASRERDALKYLNACPDQLRCVKHANADPKSIVSESLDLQQRQRDLEDERDAIRKSIELVAPWGEFCLPKQPELRLWFFVIPIRELVKFRGTQLVWHEVNHDHQFSYVVVVNPQEPTEAPGMPVSLDPRPLSELEHRKETIDDELEEIRFRRVGLTRFRDALRLDQDRADDADMRRFANLHTLDEEQVFALQCWAPKEQASKLKAFANEHNLAIAISAAVAGDDPPTLLSNPQQIAGGDGLVTFYKTPGYRMWDPSGVVFYSFALFFAMILADAGYAATLGLILAWKWKAMGTSDSGFKLRNVFRTIVLFSLVYGVLAGSYFGVSPSTDSLLGRIRLFDAQDLKLMMPLSVAVGVLHIGIANAVTAWRLRGHAGAISALGWIAIMAGGALAAFGMLGGSDTETANSLKQAGAVCFGVGMLAVFLFTSDRPFFTWSIKQHLLRILDGFSGLMKLTTLFGDVLSYLRLFALGLSSAQLAITFNNLGKDAWDSAGLGVILGIAIILFGHFLNLLLAVMSGVVHGLRLNCIEFFNWSLPEEGHQFVPFAKKVREP